MEAVVDSQSEPGTAVDTSATGYVGTLVAALEVTGNADTATTLETAPTSTAFRSTALLTSRLPLLLALTGDA